LARRPKWNHIQHGKAFVLQHGQHQSSPEKHDDRRRDLVCRDGRIIQSRRRKRWRSSDRHSRHRIVVPDRHGRRRFYAGHFIRNGNSYSNGCCHNERHCLSVLCDFRGHPLVAHLHGVRFDWRKPGDREVGKELKLPVGKPQAGFIAQDLEPVLPEAVTQDVSGIRGIQNDPIVAVLVDAVQEQQAEIVALKNEVAALKAAKK
jgi:hypothetical protein